MAWGSSAWGSSGWGAILSTESVSTGGTTLVRHQGFANEDFILNFKPIFEFEPPEPEDDLLPEQETVPTQIEEARQTTEDLINSYKAIEQFAGITQDQIDKRVLAGGGVNIRPHPVKDSLLIQAIKRQFPKEDGSRVTYEMYKECLRRMDELATEPPVTSEADILAARKDLLRTDFGGLSNTDGSNRPEIYAPEFVKPVNLDEFKNSTIKQLLKTVQPMVEEMIEDD